MTPKQIEKEIRLAFKNSKKLKTQYDVENGNSIKLRGKGNRLEIEMWYNTKTKQIETAYPLY